MEAKVCWSDDWENQGNNVSQTQEYPVYSRYGTAMTNFRFETQCNFVLSPEKLSQ